MRNQNNPNQPIHIYSYQVSSAEMYYAELEQRDIFVWDDPVIGYRIWAQVHGQGEESRIDLCQIMLEYSAYLRSWCDKDESTWNMENFGMHLGHLMAEQFRENPPGVQPVNPGACALSCLLESMHFQIGMEKAGNALCFNLATAPMDEAIAEVGEKGVELARQGIQAICRGLVQEVEPQVELKITRREEGDILYALFHREAALAV